MSINDYEPHYKQNIAQLSREIRNGVFAFRRLRPNFIPKTNSEKIRLISVPTVSDRIVQRALVAFLSKKYHAKLANEISYGFVTGRSVKSAAECACKMRKLKPWIFKTDIESFFDSISRELLVNAIRKEIKDRSLYNILLLALNCEVDDSNQKDAKQLNKLGIKSGLGIRQGMPLSPLFSNLLLFSFDRSFRKMELKLFVMQMI